MMDVRTLGIEGDWFTIAQNRQQWSTICEQQFYLSNAVEFCAANRLSQSQTFLYVHAVILLSALETSQDIRIFVALNKITMEAWKPLLFTVSMEGLSVGKGTLPGTHIFARLFNPDY